MLEEHQGFRNNVGVTKLQKTMNRLTLSIALPLCLTTSTLQADLIVNGSFENPELPGHTWTVFQSIPGWDRTVGHSIEVQNRLLGDSPFFGYQLVELDSYANSGMAQQIPTVAGQIYQLSFAYSPRPSVSTASNGIEVYFDNVLIDSMAENGVGLPDTSWSVRQYNVVASGSTSSLEFRATGISDSFGGYVDDVRFVAVSVPDHSSTLALFGLALLGLAAMRRKLVR